MLDGRQFGAVSAVMSVLYQTVVVKRELSQKENLSVYQSTYIPTLTYNHEFWVVFSALLGGHPRVDQNLLKALYILSVLEKPLTPSRRNWKALLGRVISGILCLACRYHDLTPEKWKTMDGWMEIGIYIDIYI